MLRRTALRNQSDKAQAREALFRRSSAEVKLRAGYTCEGCGGRLRPGEGDDHHVWRRARVSRTLADDPRCRAYLCRECHRFVTDEPGCPLDVRLMREALERLGVNTEEQTTDGCMAAIRRYEREHVA